MAPPPGLPPEPAQQLRQAIPVLQAEPAPEPALAAAPSLEVAPPAEDPSVSSAIDDDLMKEFAAAVENQKAATAASKALEAPPPGTESEDLMGQFENFVQKKEGS
jgi:hypothetical protein